MNVWFNFILTQWWIWWLLGAVFLSFIFILLIEDEKAVELLGKRDYALVSMLMALISAQLAVSNPAWGALLGATSAYAALVALPSGIKSWIVRRDKAAWLALMVIILAIFVLAILPNLTPSLLQFSLVVLMAYLAGFFSGVFFYSRSSTNLEETGRMLRADSEAHKEHTENSE